MSESPDFPTVSDGEEHDCSSHGFLRHPTEAPTVSDGATEEIEARAQQATRCLREQWRGSLHDMPGHLGSAIADIRNLLAALRAKDAEIERLEAENRQWYEAAVEWDERIERLEAEKATMVPAFQLAEGVLKQAALRATLERVGERLAFTTDWGSLAEIQRWITDALDAVALSEPTEAEVLAEDLARVHSLAKPDWATERPCRLADCRIVGEHWHDGYRYWGSVPDSPAEGDERQIRCPKCHMAYVVGPDESEESLAAECHVPGGHHTDTEAGCPEGVMTCPVKGCSVNGEMQPCQYPSCCPAEGDEELPPLNWAGYPPPLPDVPSPEEPSPDA